VLALLSLIHPVAVPAHARLVRSNPAGQAQVTASPERVELWFSELLEDGFNSVEIVRVAELVAKKRSNLAHGAPTVDLGDRTHMVVPVQHLDPGHYTVEWRVLSRDGHSATGRFTFWVRTGK
jgi:methionine-rich copper-binding protein CopC